jgi:hypothetical protein
MVCDRCCRKKRNCRSNILYNMGCVCIGPCICRWGGIYIGKHHLGNYGRVREMGLVNIKFADRYTMLIEDFNATHAELEIVKSHSCPINLLYMECILLH